MCSSKRSAPQIQHQKGEIKKKKKQRQKHGPDRIDVRKKKQGFKKRKERPHDCVQTVLKICRGLLDDNGGGLETLSDDGQGGKDDRMKLVSVREEEGRFTCCNCCKWKEKRAEAEAGLIPPNLDNQDHGGLSEPALGAPAPLTRSTCSTREKVKILLRDLGRRLASDTYGASVQLLAESLCSVCCRGLAKFISFTVSKTWFQNSRGFNDPKPT